MNSQDQSRRIWDLVTGPPTGLLAVSGREGGRIANAMADSERRRTTAFQKRWATWTPKPGLAAGW